jgi:hypothetical protein
MSSHAQPWQDLRRAASPRLPMAPHRSVRRPSSGLAAIPARLRRWTAPVSSVATQQRRLVTAALRAAAHASTDQAFAEIIESAAIQLTGAERATCVMVDARRCRMRSEARRGRPGFEGPLVGVAGFVARSGIPLYAEHAGDDHRYRSVVDDPSGSPEDRLAAVPVVDDDGVVLAALMVTRSADAPRFATAERNALTAFAARLVPVMSRRNPGEPEARRPIASYLRERFPRTDAQLAEMVRVFFPAVVLAVLLALFWRS